MYSYDRRAALKADTMCHEWATQIRKVADDHATRYGDSVSIAVRKAGVQDAKDLHKIANLIAKRKFTEARKAIRRLDNTVRELIPRLVRDSLGLESETEDP